MPPLELFVPLGLGVLFIGFLLFVMLWAVLMQKKALARQKQAMTHVDESLSISRQILDLSERSKVIAEESLKNQQEMVKLLRDIANTQKLR